MTDLCNGCGGCCDPVPLAFTPDLVRRIPLRRWLEAGFTERDRDWILNDLTRLPRREGRERAGYMTQGGITYGSVHGEFVAAVTHFYSCRWYDPDARRCTNYENRPSMCSGYPWYGNPPDPLMALPPECGHRVEIGQPVTIRT